MVGMIATVLSLVMIRTGQKMGDRGSDPMVMMMMTVGASR